MEALSFALRRLSISTGGVLRETLALMALLEMQLGFSEVSDQRYNVTLRGVSLRSLQLHAGETERC